MNKKEIVFTILSILLLAVLIHFVSAAESSSQIVQDLGSFIDGAKDFFTMFFEKILGESSTTTVFFERVLILLIIYGVVYSVLNNFDLFSNSPFILFFISAAVSILGVKFFTDSFIQTILVPYGALGASVAILLPFLIWFMFVHTSVKGPFARRAAWVLFGIVFIGLFIAQYTLSPTTNWIYIIGFFLVLACIFLDPQIHKYFGYVKISKGWALHNTERVAILNSQIQKIKTMRDNGAISRADAKALIAQKQQSLKDYLSNT